MISSDTKELIDKFIPVFEAIYTYLREIAGLYKVDIIDLRSLDNPYLIPEIKKEGIVIYAKK
jgi:hypothetical protein